ncbi:hypothetical protein AK812_SmicGene10471, partial [Symbiodinium microadriaticum]
MAMRAGVGSSLSYQIENVHLLADQVPGLQQSSVPAGATSYNITVARAFTKLLGAFVTFNKTGENHVSNFEYPGEAFPNVSAATIMEGQLQLGALQFPRNSVKSIAEYHHFLEIMAGTYDSKIRNMRLPNFDNTDFIAAFPTERVPKHPTSGISTRSGDLCRFTFKQMLADRVDSCFIGLVSMQIVTLSGSGVILDDGQTPPPVIELQGISAGQLSLVLTQYTPLETTTQNTADIGVSAAAIAALQGQVAALPAAPDLAPYALASDLAAAEGSIAANASGLVAVNTSLSQGLATKANQSALDAL